MQFLLTLWNLRTVEFMSSYTYRVLAFCQVVLCVCVYLQLRWVFSSETPKHFWREHEGKIKESNILCGSSLELVLMKHVSNESETSLVSLPAVARSWASSGPRKTVLEREGRGGITNVLYKTRTGKGTTRRYRCRGGSFKCRDVCFSVIRCK